MGKDASAIKQEIEQTRERMGDTVEALGYKADVGSRVKDNVQDKVEAVKGTIGDVVESVKASVNGASDSVSGAGDGARGGVAKVQSAVSKLNDGFGSRLSDADVNGKTQRAIGMAKENPIGLALAGLAVGYLVGSLLPVSDVERERLGPIRDRVVDQAQAATNDLVEAGKAVVAETAQSVVASAFSSAKTHGHEVVDAAKARAEQP